MHIKINIFQTANSKNFFILSFFFFLHLRFLLISLDSLNKLRTNSWFEIIVRSLDTIIIIPLIATKHATLERFYSFIFVIFRDLYSFEMNIYNPAESIPISISFCDALLMFLDLYILFFLKPLEILSIRFRIRIRRNSAYNTQIHRVNSNAKVKTLNF